MKANLKVRQSAAPYKNISDVQNSKLYTMFTTSMIVVGQWKLTQKKKEKKRKHSSQTYTPSHWRNMVNLYSLRAVN